MRSLPESRLLAPVLEVSILVLLFSLLTLLAAHSSCFLLSSSPSNKSLNATNLHQRRLAPNTFRFLPTVTSANEYLTRWGGASLRAYVEQQLEVEGGHIYADCYERDRLNNSAGAPLNVAPRSTACSLFRPGS